MKWLYLLIFGFAGLPSFAQLTVKLDSLFRQQAPDKPGFALSIEKNGEIIYRKEKGLAAISSPDGHLPAIPLDGFSNFRMASLSKQFTAMGILLLEKEHRLSFDDPIHRFLPEIPARIGNMISIRHLLTHSSGLLDYESLIPINQSAQVLDGDVLLLLSKQDSTYFRPGSRFRYSNSGFCLLALIIERASGLSFPSFIRQRIFRPLHMDNSTVYEAGKPLPHRAMGYARDSTGAIIPSDQSITSATKGDGGIYTSLEDYSKWLRALQSNRFLRLSAVLKNLRRPIEGIPEGYYAAGWFDILSQPEVLFHSGSTCGFANFVIRIPGDAWSIVYFSNLADNITPFRSILRVLQEEGVANLSQVFKLYDLTF